VRWPVSHWELIVGGLAVVAAAVAFWVTLHAHFLQYPGWLAVQKADFILGPIGVGLYWRHRRPDNRLGLLLIALGLVAIPYIGESSSSPWPFSIGTGFEYVIEPLTLAVILAFPNGRLGRVEWAILAVMLVGQTLATLVVQFPVAGQITPYFSISACRALCPANPWYSHSLYSSIASWLPADVDVTRAAMPAAWLATVGLLGWRFVTGTAPRRRALAIGAPIAVCFLVASAAYQIIQLVNPQFDSTNAEPTTTWLQWVVAASRSAVWYGFLFALIAAELYAGRVLRRLNRDSLGRPSFRELEGLLRGPLGDPGLRLGFWRAGSSEWVDADGARLPPPGAGQTSTEVDRDGRAVIAIVHDKQLSEDPELLQAAGAVALLALENAELDVAWRESVRELARSRARLAAAGDRERRKLERDLHDSAQQRFVAAEINLALAGDLAAGNPELVQRLGDANVALEEGLEELRQVAHGVYPRELARWGLGRALGLLAARYPGQVTVMEADVGRCRSEIEATVYYGCLEAVQNASKHAGADAQISIRLYTDADELLLEVRDDGRGFDVDAVDDGVGLQNIRDRFGAVGGRVEIRSQPGHGTVMLAAVHHHAG
jgi:signal transduction histidine kinase